MKKIASLILLFASTVFATAQQYLITSADIQRAESLVSQMTLEEKCKLITGQNDGFYTAGIERLGIPVVRMADGPQGVRNKTNSTYYPCGLSLAASFNREVANSVGCGIGDDARARGVRIMLCPGVNIYRSANCGRNFEYYGEDPYLASEQAVNYISGIQSKRVMATVKHFACNNQEYARHQITSLVDERTLNEIYFPTFRKAVEIAHVGAVMTSYNAVNGVHAAENPWLIGQLRKWGHQGIVMSDWTSTYSTYGCLTSGLDLEMPQGWVLNYEAVKPFVENGVVPERTINEKCIHILAAFSAYGLLDKPMKDEDIPEDYDKSRNAAYAAAIEGPVLLKNDDILPLKKGLGYIVLVGPNSDVIAFGGGSGAMSPFEQRKTTLFKGLSALGRGYKLKYAGTEIKDEELIRKARAVIVSVGFSNKTESENSDRTYALPEGQNELILKACELNSKVIVVVNSGGEIDVNPWIDKVKGLMMAWYFGQEGGRAIADLISGKVSPSGRLPFTFWGSLEANPCQANYEREIHPMLAANKKGRDPYPYSQYREGVFVGYRGVEKFGVEPMFPFGYGLTYSTFEYSGLKVVPADGGYDVSFTVTNKGKEKASEVAQVYVGQDNASVPRPVRELKGFEKVCLGKGESREVTVHLKREAFCYYNTLGHSWKKDDAASYRIEVGKSASDIVLSDKIEF